MEKQVIAPWWPWYGFDVSFLDNYDNFIQLRVLCFLIVQARITEVCTMERTSELKILWDCALCSWCKFEGKFKQCIFTLTFLPFLLTLLLSSQYQLPGGMLSFQRCENILSSQSFRKPERSWHELRKICIQKWKLIWVLVKMIIQIFKDNTYILAKL